MIGALVLLTASLNFSNLNVPVDVSGIVKAANTSGAMEIAADSTFSSKTFNFAPNQTVYVRVAADNDGADKHNLNVHDSDYNLLATYPMARSGNQFTAIFAAPASQGTYSLEADITSGGSVTNFVQTITVGGTASGNSQTKVNVENKVNSDSRIGDKDAPSPSLSPLPSPVSAVGGQKQNIFVSIWSAVTAFFKNLF